MSRAWPTIFVWAQTDSRATGAALPGSAAPVDGPYFRPNSPASIP